MKKLSLLLAAVMLLSCLHLGAFAEGPIEVRFTSYDQVNAAITIIPADGDQIELGYLNGVTEILEVDGLKFKDMNGNGSLDVYEDWRQDIDARVNDLYSQMNIVEKSGLFYHTNTCNNPGGVDFADSKLMFGTDEELGIESEKEEAADEGGSGGGMKSDSCGTASPS